VNKELVNDQSLYTKCDKLVGWQTAEIAQFVRFCDSRRDVFGTKYGRERQILAWQL
jgi:hypothetical protein